MGNLDYVCGWDKKATDFMQNAPIKAALVSTNSVSQGDAVPTLWKTLFEDGIHIDFAWQTFVWDSKANDKAHVHVVIIGFSAASDERKHIIFSGENSSIASHINAYLIDAPDIFVSSRSKPICAVPVMGIGSQPIDNGNYLFET